jgi:hypothetical protein
MIKTKLAFLAALPLCSSICFSQDCSKYVKENEELKQQLQSLQVQYGISNNTEAQVKNLNAAILLKVLDVSGSKNEQTVTVKFQLFQETKPHQQVVILTSDQKAYDDYGNEYITNFMKLGTGQGSYSVSNQLPTGVAINGEVRFVKVLPNVTRFKLAMIHLNSKDFDDGANKIYGDTEISNLKIQWK